MSRSNRQRAKVSFALTTIEMFETIIESTTRSPFAFDIATPPAPSCAGPCSEGKRGGNPKEVRQTYRDDARVHLDRHGPCAAHSLKVRLIDHKLARPVLNTNNAYEKRALKRNATRHSATQVMDEHKYLQPTHRIRTLLLWCWTRRLLSKSR